MSETLTPLGEIRVNVLRGGLSGVGTAGRLAEWESSTVLGDSTLVKSGVGVLTLSAAGDYTLTVPATGTAALLAADNAFSGSNTFSGTVNTIAPGGLRLGTPISQTPMQGGIIARGAGSLVNHGFFSAYWNFYFAANAYHDGTGWKALATNDGTNGYSALFRSDIGGLGAALIVEADSTLRTAGDTRTYTTILSLEFDGQLQLPVSGSSAGLLLGGDALLYRSAADILRTPDSLLFDGYLRYSGAAKTSPSIAPILTIYSDASNWAYHTYDSGTIYRVIYGKTSAGAMEIGQSADMASGAFTRTMRLQGGNVIIDGGLNVGLATGAGTAEVYVESAAGANPAIRILDGDSAQPFSAFPSTFVGGFTVWSGTAGGLNIQGVSDSDATGFGYVARVGATTTTVPAMVHRAGKHNGSAGTANLADAEIHSRWEKFDGTALVTLYGNGNINTAGVYQKGGTQVVGARVTGWGTPTGTLYRTALTNASTQAQFNQAIMAVVTDLIAHGLIGA